MASLKQLSGVCPRVSMEWRCGQSGVSLAKKQVLVPFESLISEKHTVKHLKCAQLASDQHYSI